MSGEEEAANNCLICDTPRGEPVRRCRACGCLGDSRDIKGRRLPCVIESSSRSGDIDGDGRIQIGSKKWVLGLQVRESDHEFFRALGKGGRGEGSGT